MHAIPTAQILALCEESIARMSVIKMLIGVGLGWSVLPATMIDDQVSVLDIDADIHRTLGVIHHVNRTLSNAGEAFIEMLRASTSF